MSSVIVPTRQLQIASAPSRFNASIVTRTALRPQLSCRSATANKQPSYKALTRHLRRASTQRVPRRNDVTVTARTKMTESGQSAERANEVKGVLLRDYKQGQYLVTGNLTEAIYTRFCRVSDPTGVIWGIKLYQNIIARLFDPKQSTIKLKNITVTDPSNIVATWTKEGFLQLPWRPYLTTQEGKTYYTLDKNGLICVHKQTWDNMTPLQAIRIALTPTSGKKP